MTKYLKLIEAYPPRELGQEGAFVFESLGAMYGHVMGKKIECPDIQKLMIHYSSEGKSTDEYKVTSALDVLSIEAGLIEDLNEFRQASRIEKYRYANKNLSRVLEFFATKYCNYGNLFDEYAEIIVKSDFRISNELVKKKNGPTEVTIFWVYDEFLTYSFALSFKGMQISSGNLLKKQTRYITEKNDIGKLSTCSEGFRLDIPGSQNYWQIGLDGNVNVKNDLAQSGDGKEQFSLALFHLSDANPQKNAQLGRHWLEQSLKNGFDKAGRELRKRAAHE